MMKYLIAKSLPKILPPPGGEGRGEGTRLALQVHGPNARHRNVEVFKEPLVGPGAIGDSNALFPLTPALSLRERETFSASTFLITL